jgi:hypothetical protein
MGSAAPVEQGSKYTWNFYDGLRTVLSFKGTAAQVNQLMQTYITVAGYNPSVDSLNFDAGRGLASLEVNLMDDGAILYELYPMEDRVAVEASDYYQTATGNPPVAALSVNEIQAVLRRIQSGGTINTGAWNQKQQDLFTELACGRNEVLVTRWALRETKRVSQRSTVAATHNTVDRVDPPPSTSAINTLIGQLPTGEWLRRGTVVRTVNSRRWELITEWWWARAWSAAHYGGTLTP